MREYLKSGYLDFCDLVDFRPDPKLWGLGLMTLIAMVGCAFGGSVALQLLPLVALGGAFVALIGLVFLEGMWIFIKAVGRTVLNLIATHRQTLKDGVSPRRGPQSPSMPG